MSAPASYVPLREVEHPAPADELLKCALRRANRVGLLAGAAEFQLEQLAGCEINRADIMELFGMIAEEAQELSSLMKRVQLAELRDEGRLL